MCLVIGVDGQGDGGNANDRVAIWHGDVGVGKDSITEVMIRVAGG